MPETAPRARHRPPRRRGRAWATAAGAESWLLRLDDADRQVPLSASAATELRKFLAGARLEFARERGGPPVLGADPVMPGEAAVAVLKLRFLLEPRLVPRRGHRVAIPARVAPARRGA